MKKKTVKFFSFLFVAITLFVNTAVSTSASGNTIDAFGEEMEFSNKARAIYLYSTNANKVLFSTGDNEIMDVGPIAKVMTGLIACETLSDRLHTPVNITTQMVNGVSGNSMQLKDGMTLEIEDLLFGTICGGNNDAAQAIAMICESNISAFVQRMNAYASELGMTNTHFSNPTGLDDTPSQTTISDVAKLVKKASKNELYMKISSAKSRKISDEITVLNRNALISQFSDQRYYNKNAKGIIAGSTNSSGYTVATYADNGNTSYICIVMGAVAEADHTYSYYIANKLIDFAFNNFSSKK